MQMMQPILIAFHFSLANPGTVSLILSTKLILALLFENFYL